MGLFFNEDINTLFVGADAVSAVYMGSEKVWPVGLPVGQVFNFEYTGTVQSVELPRGKYKLQCWGAQGGNVTGTYAVNGSKGGYSEGVLTLTKTTTLYIFVGGQGASYTSSASQTSTTSINGGWNGGGAGVRTSRYNSGDTDGRSFPRPGGGATDISTVTSSMSYSSGRTNRSSASLLARCIVAGGGGGASARYTITETTTTSDKTTTLYDKNVTISYGYVSGDYIIYNAWIEFTAKAGVKYTASYTINSTLSSYQQGFFTTSGNGLGSSYTPTSDMTLRARCILRGDLSSTANGTVRIVVKQTTQETTTSSSKTNSKSNQSQQGGGTSGKGQYPGKATSAGSGGAFGLGANQATTIYRYCGGGGGGGWYGGGTAYSDSSTSYINYSGGGSGFVNTAANASSRPSGYTGLQLDSGTTKDGSTSFESTSGGTETGHSGNGYARITVIG